MIGYVIICFVDTNEISHKQKITNEIIDLINQADIVSSDFTFLFKNDDFESSFQNFKYDVLDFLNDPIGMYWDEEDEDDDEDEIETIIRQHGGGEEEPDVIFSYEADYKPLYLQFVSSIELFNAYCNEIENIHPESCSEFYFLKYTITCIDQMEILKRLQCVQTEKDIMDKFIVSSSEKRKELIKKLHKMNKN